MILGFGHHEVGIIPDIVHLEDGMMPVLILFIKRVV